MNKGFFRYWMTTDGYRVRWWNYVFVISMSEDGMRRVPYRIKMKKYKFLVYSGDFYKKERNCKAHCAALNNKF